MTRIIAANGKPIETGGRALKQNYSLSKGIAKNVSLEINLSQPMDDWTFANLYKVTKQSISLGDSVDGSYTFNPEIIMMNNNDDVVLFRTRGTSFSRGMYYLVTHNRNLIDQSADDIWNYDAVNSRENRNLGNGPFKKNLDTYVIKSDSVLRFKFWHGYTNGLIVNDIRVSNYLAVNKMIFNWRVPTSQSVANEIIQSRLVIFNRAITQRELDYFYNSGTSNNVLSTFGLQAEFDFNECKIVNISGIDCVGFIDQSGNGHHAKVISTLPAGTLQEQCDHVNQNQLRPWNI